MYLAVAKAKNKHASKQENKHASKQGNARSSQIEVENQEIKQASKQNQRSNPREQSGTWKESRKPVRIE